MACHISHMYEYMAYKCPYLCGIMRADSLTEVFNRALSQIAVSASACSDVWHCEMLPRSASPQVING